MGVQTTAPLTDFRHEFADFEGVTYLNGALQGPMPLVAARAAQEALEWKQHPYRLPDDIYFDLPDRIREKIAGLISAQPEEIAVTTGASSGMACVAAGIDWKPGDEVLVGRGEFPSHFATWLRYRQAGKLTIRVVEPRGRFIDAEDYLAQIGPQTRLVSASLVRFDNGVRLDAARIGQACEKVGAAFLLDVTQLTGAMKCDIRTIGATMAVCSGYKWLLGPYGAGFFWIANEWIERLPLGAVYFMALEGPHDFHARYAEASGHRALPGARRWDSAETANFTNLSAFNSSLELVQRIGIEAIEQHIDTLIEQLIERLPRDRCALASPEERAKRGPYVCISAVDPANSTALYEKLRAARIHVSLRGTALRVAPHFYNTAADIDRFIEAVKS
jgi:cysteine desulfurase/selenocysteine lyase